MAHDSPLRLDFCRLEESSALVRLTATGDAQLVSATLYGPHCEFARTLPGDTRFQTGGEDSATAALVATVMEPCYWTPALPFLYQLEVLIRDGRGNEVGRSIAIALRRWSASRQSFRLEGKRRVLRGAALEKISPDDLTEARATESALIAQMPDEAVLALADRMGVALVVDLRGSRDLFRDLGELSCHPAALLVVADAGQRERLHHMPLPTHVPLGTVLGPLDAAGPGVVMLELGANDRPSTWAGTHDAPVIVVRGGSGSSTIRECRAVCDRLQAELSPEFDLAGYFVTRSVHL